MSPSTRTVLVTLTVLTAVGLTACTTTPTPVEPESFVPGPEVSTDVATPTPIPREASAVMFLRATATASTGAQLELELQLNQSFPWDYVGTQTLPAAMVADCAGELSQEIFAAEQWSFARMNVAALSASGSTDWPDDEQIDLRPSAEFAYSSGRGILDNITAAGNAKCRMDKFFSAAGNGGMAVAFPADASSLTSWVEYTYGFETTGVTLSNCSIEVTDLGRQYGAESESWATIMSETTCAAGTNAERRVDRSYREIG